ncbi:hypothetical protein GCM10009533_58780 [Saccharopolyspora spinosporotrichia]|uniref:Uncharacterized protein n=2 Tax=Saccharopolyspora erythraea TaxID=1836 RepID=A0ABN1DWS2_SACER
MEDDPDAGVAVEILRLMKFAGVRDDIAIDRFHQLVDRHGHSRVREALVAVTSGDPQRPTGVVLDDSDGLASAFSGLS